MKNFTLTLIVLLFTTFFINTANSQCDHTLYGSDSYGDGWNGYALDISVNGSVVVSGFTLSTGASGSVTFSATEGDTIDVTWTSFGSYGYEISWYISDGTGSTIITGSASAGASTTANCTAAAPCETITSFPYSHGFEDLNCWTNSNASTAWALDAGDDFGPGSVTEGTSAVFFDDYSYSTGSTSDLMSPNLDLSYLTIARLSFDYYDGGDSDTVSVLVDDGTGAVVVYTTDSTVDSWTTINVDLPDYAGQTVKIGFRGTSVYGYSNPHIDNLSVAEAPSCAEASSLTASISDFSYGTASLSWTSGSGNDSYSYEVFEGTDTTAASVDSGNTSSTSVDLTGLLDNQLYTFVITPSCGTNSATATSTTFITNNKITGASSEDFSGFTSGYLTWGVGGNLPGSWYTTSGNLNWQNDVAGTSSSNTGPSTGSSDGTATDVYLYIETSSGSQGDIATLMTPYYDVTSMTTPRVALDYHMYGETIGDLNLIVVESDGTETSLVSISGQQQSASSDDWLTATADLSSYMSEVIRFKITASRGSSYTGDIAIDDFTIEETPSCESPTGITSSSVTGTTATVSWTAATDNDSFAYVIYEGSDDSGTSVDSGTTTSNSIDFTGLTAETTYYVVVTASCSGESASSVNTSFTTSCAVTTTGFTQNFNGLSALPSCWEVVNGGGTNTWVYNTNGYVAIQYNSSAHDDYLKSPAFTVSDGLTDGFSFQANNYSSYYQEQIDIIVEDQTNGTSTIIESAYAPLTVSFESKFYDLSAYEGSDVRISFHITTTNLYAIFLDNFVVGSASSMSAGWAGFTSTSYSNAQNWYAGSVPTGDVTLNLNSDSASNSPTIDSAVSASSLTVETGVSLTISENGSLQTTGDFTNGGTVTMNSTATAHSSLIVGGSSTGSITYNRYVDIDRWYITSSPVSDQDIDTFISNEDLAVSTNNSSIVGLADYNNDGSQYAADPTITTGWWDYYEAGQSDSGDFAVGEGKIVRLASDATDNLLGFTGTISGSVSIPMTVATTAFNLIGNPYPAAVQVTSQGGGTDALSANSSGLSEVTAWFWNGSENGYTAVNQNPSQATKIAAPGQGFFVNAAGSGDFSFTPSMQTTTAGSFNRQTEWSKIDLSMSADGQTSDTEIVYFDGATTGWDNGYDSTNWSSGSFQIFTSHVDTSTTQNLAIQSLPLGNFNDMVVPVGVNASAGQMITISVDTTNWPEDVNIYLEDVDNGSYTLLDGQNAEFTTLLDSNESGIGRFYIHTTSNSLGDDDLTLTDVSIYASSRDNLRILGINSGEANVQMFDLMGKQVLNTSFNGQSVNDVKLPNLNTGIYLVNLASDEGTVNKKIIIQ